MSRTSRRKARRKRPKPPYTLTPNSPSADPALLKPFGALTLKELRDAAEQLPKPVVGTPVNLDHGVLGSLISLPNEVFGPSPLASFRRVFEFIAHGLGIPIDQRILIAPEYEERPKMTETEWLTSDDPLRMLDFAQGVVGRIHDSVEINAADVKMTDRQRDLLACAWWRHIPLHDERQERLIREVEEKGWGVNSAGIRFTAGTVFDACRKYAFNSSGTEAKLFRSTGAALNREIVGNPFRIDKDQHWPFHKRQQYCTKTVLSLAQAAYEQRPGRKCERCGGTGVQTCSKCSGEGCSVYGIASNGPCTAGLDCPDCHGTGRITDGTLDNDRLAVLADALEDAGCTDEDILEHLRSLGPHVRGCWALDLILGRK